MENMEDMEDLERLIEKEFDERVERIQNTMSRFRKIAYILMVIAAVFMFFHARNDYNNYAGKRTCKRHMMFSNQKSLQDIVPLLERTNPVGMWRCQRRRLRSLG